MAIKYVRKTGSDANGGTGPSDAYLTVGKLLQNLSAGDTGYIGAGLYRENALNPTNSGTAGNVILIKGDLDGSQTGDAGIVRITASADDSAYTNAKVFAMTRNYITLDSLWCDMSSGNCIEGTGTNNTIQNCWISYCKGKGIYLSGTTPTVTNCRVWNILKNGEWGIHCDGGNVTIDNCFVQQVMGSGACKGIEARAVTSFATITVKNCFVEGIYPDGGAPDSGIYMNMNSISGATGNLYNNTVHKVKSGGANACEGVRFAGCITGQTLNIYNNEFFNILADAGTNNTYAIVITGGSTPTINGDYNMWSDCRDGVSGYTANTNDRSADRNILVPALPNGVAGFELGYYLDTLSDGKDTGTSSGAPTTDIMGRPRGGGFGFDIGAFEKQGKIAKELTVFDVTPATNIEGAGYIDFEFAVRSGQTYTIAAKLTRNSTYGAGTQPSFTVLSNDVGMSGTISFTGSADTYQTCSIPTTSMTASADGVISVRFQTYGMTAGSVGRIDTITISE